MARYRKIDPRIWNDAKFRELSDNGKLVFLFCLTHVHMTALGAMRATMEGLAAEIGWTAKAFREAFQEASQQGLLVADEKACFVAAPNFIKYNQPESPNVVRSWIASVDLIPECQGKNELLCRVSQYLEGLSEAFPKAFAEVFPQASPHPTANQEQEQEQEQDKKDTGVSKRKRGKARAKVNVPFDPIAIDLPEVLDSDQFREAWASWCRHRREIRKPLTETSANQQMKELAKWGEVRAIDAINHSIQQTYQGIFERGTRGSVNTHTEQQRRNKSAEEVSVL